MKLAFHIAVSSPLVLIDRSFMTLEILPDRNSSGHTLRLLGVVLVCSTQFVSEGVPRSNRSLLFLQKRVLISTPCQECIRSWGNSNTLVYLGLAVQSPSLWLNHVHVICIVDIRMSKSVQNFYKILFEPNSDISGSKISTD